jgi:transposase
MFWMIYDEDIQKEEWKQKIQQRIAQWNEIRQTIIEVDNVISTIEKRLESISNYFISGHSNWFAEWLNSRIQRLISMSRWFKNKDYMIYRIIKLFSWESHLI